ncbi:MAG: hypothetical protein P8Z67_11070, partial [Gammaproteobacteria bacterium]
MFKQQVVAKLQQYLSRMFLKKYQPLGRKTMKNSVRRLASAAVLAALAVPTTSFATNGYFSDAYSTKNGGLAGAGVALP